MLYFFSKEEYTPVHEAIGALSNLLKKIKPDQKRHYRENNDDDYDVNGGDDDNQDDDDHEDVYCI